MPTTPAIAKELGYSKLKTYIDVELPLMRKTDFWDESDALFKTISIRDYEQIDGIWTARTMEAKNLKSGHSTVFSIAEVRYNSTCNLTVHPHACGECYAQTSGINKAGGSPPRLWGMQRMAPSRFRGWRFTPTPVGNAASLVIAPHLASVHPHACGECTAKRLGREPQGGSPPRLWGMLETCQVLH